MSYVYFVSCRGYLKIGVAKNVRQRMRELQTGNPFELKLEGAAIVDSIAAFGVETALHDGLRNRAALGEWFSISFAEAMDMFPFVRDRLLTEELPVIPKRKPGPPKRVFPRPTPPSTPPEELERLAREAVAD